MSQDDVLDRKELKAPDKFQETATRAIDWLGGHKQGTRAALVALAAFLVVSIVAMVAAGSRREKAGALAYEVIRAAGGEVSSVPMPGMPGPLYATDAERQRAVIAEADRAIAAYASSAGGRLALLMKADAQLRLGETDAAVASFEKYLSASASDEPLRFGALEGIAVALEAKGQLAEAAAAWERAGREVPFVADRADLERARLLARAGKADEAAQVLKAFPERHKESPLAADAAERLTRLGAK